MEFLYLHYQDAVNHDHNLLIRYVEHFGDIAGRESCVKRTGRALRLLERKSGANRFKRDANFERLSREQERQAREEWKR